MFKSGTTVWYNVKNLQESVHFYTQVLGFELDFEDSSQRMAFVKTNTLDCYIGLAEAETVIPVTSSVVFEVDNIEQTVDQLSKRGLTFTGGIETIPDFVKLATFTDPDGHCFELSQTLVASA